jgi:hypothetical protein
MFSKNLLLRFPSLALSTKLWSHVLWIRIRLDCNRCSAQLVLLAHAQYVHFVLGLLRLRLNNSGSSFYFYTLSYTGTNCKKLKIKICLLRLSLRPCPSKMIRFRLCSSFNHNLKLFLKLVSQKLFLAGRELGERCEVAINRRQGRL